MLRMLRAKADQPPVIGKITEPVAATSTISSLRGQILHGKKRILAFIFFPILLVGAGASILFYLQYSSVQALASLAVTDPVCGIWQPYLPPASLPAASSFTGVSVLSKDDAWFVGPGISAHWDGKGLSILPGPQVQADEVFINDVVFSSDDDGWAVGSFIQGGTSNRQSNLLSFHWDGKVWTHMPTPNLTDNIVGSYPQSPNKDAALDAVVLISKNDVWAVGSYPQQGTLKTLILHWDGIEWTKITSPNIEDTDNRLLSLAALSKYDIWAFGLRKVGAAAWENQPLSMHWDGTTWQIVDSPTTLAEIRAASVSPSKDLWVISLAVNAMQVQPNGMYTLGSAVRAQGSEWNEIPMPHINDPVLRSVVALSSDDVWAVGYQGYHGLVLHWNGTAWSEIPVPSPSPVQHLVDIAGVTNDIWVVGDSADDIGNPSRPMLAHFVACSSSTP